MQRQTILSPLAKQAMVDYFDHINKNIEKIIVNPEQYCTPFGGGFSGRVPFKLTLENKAYVIRELDSNIDEIINYVQDFHRKKCGLPNNGEDEFIKLTNKYRDMNLRERTLNLIAAENNLGPQLYNQDPLVLITDIAPGRPLNSSDCCKPEIIPETINALVKLHTIPLDDNTVKQQNLISIGSKRVDVCYYFLKDKDDPNMSYLEPLYAKYKKLEEALEKMGKKMNIPNTWVHGDPNGGNLLYERTKNQNQRISLIDWTDGGLGNPYFDLALYVLYMYDDKNNACPNEDMIKTILKSYESSKAKINVEPSTELFEYFQVMIEFAVLYRALEFMRQLSADDKKIQLNEIQPLQFDDLRKKILNKEINLNNATDKALVVKSYLERFKNNQFIDHFIEKAAQKTGASIKPSV